MGLDYLSELPVSVGAGAVYPYSDELLSKGVRKSKYESEPYNLFRVVGAGEHRRIWVPRNMVTKITQDFRSKGVPCDFKSKFVPRNSEQARIIKESVELLTQRRSFMLEAPTGFGKTWCATDIIAKIGLKTIIIVTKEDIRDQWLEACTKVLGLTVGKGVGFIQGDICNTLNAKVVIAFIQSISKDQRYPEHVFKDFGLAIWDECHRIGADFFSQSAFRIPSIRRLGISATPDRNDGKEEVLEAHIGSIMVRTELAPMPFKVIARRTPWEIPCRPQQINGKWINAPIPHSPGKMGHVTKMLSHHHGRNKMLVDFIVAAHAKGRITLVQSELREHLETIATLLTSSKVPVTDISYYVGGMTKLGREEAKLKPVIMATYAMTAEATDIPVVDTLVMCTPRSDVRQIVGRARRFLPDKPMPLVFDLIDDSSDVLRGYWMSRKKWYGVEQAEISLSVTAVKAS